ncbi:MAG: hypothetical protein DI585_00755 [Pseudomonas fluorescens]|nr:MAG: hypothetical protein DI585_00755 [Pseudomonas fluorescens]
MKSIALAALAATTLATVSHAQSYASTETSKVTIGAGVMVKPEYSGSDDYETLPIPMVAASTEITPGNTLYLRGLTAGLDHAVDDQLTIGLMGNYRFERDSSDSATLTGMPDIDGAFEMGPKVRYQVNPLLGLEAHALFDVSGAHEGYTARAGADYKYPLSRVTMLTLEGGLNYGSDDYVTTYYGVAPAYAAPGRPAYSLDAGFTHVDAAIGVRHALTRNWSVQGKVGADYLIGDAADSPLVKDELQPKAMLGVAYSF